MIFVVDTQVWLWANLDRSRLRKRALGLLEDSDNVIYFSTVSAAEIAIKHSLGKLSLPAAPAEYVPVRVASGGFRILRLELGHALGVARLPLHHRDPFDRLLIAQARSQRVPIMTSDPRFSQYEVEVILAA